MSTSGHKVLTPLRELQDALARRKVVVVVGAGVSFATTSDPIATWRGLLRSGIAFCQAWTQPDDNWVTRAEDDLRMDRLLPLASQIASELALPGKGGSALLGKWLQSTVAQLRVGRYDPSRPEEQPSGLLDAIWQLRAPVLTTNYDTLIEDATGAGSATSRTPELIQSVLSGSEPRVVGHLHGVWGDAASIVLSEFSYGEAHGRGLLPTALRSAAYTMSLLFVGCGAGLDDPTFDRLRTWLFEELRWSTHSHFLLELAGHATEREERLGHPIKVVPYGEDYSDLEGYIRRTLLPAARAGFDPSPTARLGLAMAELPQPAIDMPLRVDDAAADFEREASAMRRQFARVHSVLRHLDDRLSEPPANWPARERTERHRFYAAGATLAAEWLEPEVGLLQQAINAMRSTVADLVAAVHAGNLEAPGTSIRGAASALADEASGIAEDAASCQHLLGARAQESREWAPLTRSLSDVLPSLEEDLERLRTMMDDLRNRLSSNSND